MQYKKIYKLATKISNQKKNKFEFFNISLLYEILILFDILIPLYNEKSIKLFSFAHL